MEIRVHEFPPHAVERLEDPEELLEAEITAWLPPWPQEAPAEWGRKQVETRRCIKLLIYETGKCAEERGEKVFCVKK